MFQICALPKRCTERSSWMSGRCGKCPPPTLPQTGWGMRADSEIASTIHPEDEIPLLGSFAQEKLSKERKKDGIETPIQMR